jgi:hypothetical protein
MENCKKGPAPQTVSVPTSKFDTLNGSKTEPLEWWLFHGTRQNAARGICSNNFRSNLAGTGSTWKAAGAGWGMPLYGFGHYFAENITKADEYAHDDSDANIHAVLLCRVCGGRTKIVTTGEIDPHSLQKEVLEGDFHSVYGDRVSVLKKPYREVVVYDSDQIFPEFLIIYRRIFG